MDDHYFSADPAVAFKRAPVRASVWGHDLELTSGSGVFAQGRLDIGTAVLFRETEPPTGGTLLDLGCGYGVIGCALATAAPTAQVWGVDVNERAVLLANENAAALGIADRFTAATPDGIPDDVELDEIWSNPPIRIGKDALHELLLTWLPRLAPGRPGGDGGRQEPGSGLVAEVARRAGVPDDATREREGLPGAGDRPAGVRRSWPCIPPTARTVPHPRGRRVRSGPSARTTSTWSTRRPRASSRVSTCAARWASGSGTPAAATSTSSR